MKAKKDQGLGRRDFLKASVVVAAAPAMVGAAGEGPATVVVDDFSRPDALEAGDQWESLNPGYWQIESGALRRRLSNVGDRARDTGFPFHWETHQGQPMPVEYDPSLPLGMLWRRDWKLKGNYTIRVEFVVRGLRPAPPPGDDPQWAQHQPGWALAGVCFGGQCLYESWQGAGRSGDAAWLAAWCDDGTFGVYDHASEPLAAAWRDARRPAPALAPGDRMTIEISVAGDDPRLANLTVRLTAAGAEVTLEQRGLERERFTEGYFGLVGRGLLDFEVRRVLLDPGDNHPLDVPLAECHVCYPLGDTLRQEEGTWRCKFIALFRNAGRQAEVRISDSPAPTGGWASIAAAGSAGIVSNSFRRNTAVIEAVLPADPSKAELYYTVWKDGADVTADPRPGFLGRKQYVGRLPRLAPPYRLCGLSCHAIHGNSPELPRAAPFQEHWVHDQPTPGAFGHLEEYGFQVMLWEDDVWYLELLIFPPSTDDAYKIITLTLAGPTTRWQMMRHWNVINPGDHDHGMDDVKGPEQLAVRRHADLGQDAEYMRRNFQIVSHLMRGDEDPSATDNPRRWRRWQMPAGDFSLVVLDSRLWRSSQDTHIWQAQGWGHKQNLYDRGDPTRSLLGEKQFAWLEQVIRTDAAPLICLSGVNGLHTIWTGGRNEPQSGLQFDQRDRVAADFAGWVTAGAERVLELLGSREGIVSVYGDVHNGCIMKNVRQRVYECCFGPIGRYGGRAVKEGFGPRMRDYDGRELEVLALYHQQYQSPQLEPQSPPKYWNFLEMQFDPRGAEPSLQLAIRNLVDGPSDAPRGGPGVQCPAHETGRPHSCRLGALTTLSDAQVRFSLLDGRPVRGARSLSDGSLPLAGLADVAPHTTLVMTAVADGEVQAQLVTTLPL